MALDQYLFFCWQETWNYVDNLLIRIMHQCRLGYLGMDTGFAIECVVADWVVSVLIGIFTLFFFKIGLLWFIFHFLRIVGITTCICECLSYSKQDSALDNDIHAHNCICASDNLYSLADSLCAFQVCKMQLLFVASMVPKVKLMQLKLY